jgi:hypothetical protein
VGEECGLIIGAAPKSLKFFQKNRRFQILTKIGCIVILVVVIFEKTEYGDQKRKRGECGDQQR